MDRAWRTEGECIAGSVLCAGAVALGLHVFVYRAGFAPGGVDGLVAILKHLFAARLGQEVNAGVLTLLINLPLLLAAWRILRRRYVLYTLLYTLSLSLFLSLYATLGLYQYDCLDPALDHSPLVAALLGGSAQGLTGYMLRIGGSSGGIDIIGGMLALYRPERSVAHWIARTGYAVSLLSLLVYGDLRAFFLSALSVFTCERVSLLLLRGKISIKK